MALDIRRLRNRRTEGTSSRRSERAHASDLPLDHQLSFSPEPQEQWHYREGRVFINDEDVGALVNDNANEIGLLSGLSFGLDRYQRHVWGRGGEGHAKFNGAIAALQGKIVGRLGALYEGLVGGVRYEFADEILWINNVNVRAVVTLYRSRPTPQARTYLRGLRDKLFLIIARHHSSPRVDGIHGIVNHLIGEIDVVLAHHAPPDIPLLVAATGTRDRCA